MKKKFAVACLSIAVGLCLVSCTVVPKKTQAIVVQVDSSTPSQYPENSGGFLGFKDNRGLYTSNAITSYNTLIDRFRLKLKANEAVDLKANDGVAVAVDKYGNNVFSMDKEHMLYFILLRSYLRDRLPVDTLTGKILDKVQ